MGFNRIEPDLPSGKFLQFDPENEQFIVETSLPIPIWQGLCYFTGGHILILGIRYL